VCDINLLKQLICNLFSIFYDTDSNLKRYLYRTKAESRKASRKIAEYDISYSFKQLRRFDRLVYICNLLNPGLHTKSIRDIITKLVADSHDAPPSFVRQ